MEGKKEKGRLEGGGEQREKQTEGGRRQTDSEMMLRKRDRKEHSP